MHETNQLSSRLIAGFCLLGLVGGAVGYQVARTRPVDVGISPADVVLQDPVQPGEIATAQLQVYNHSATPLTLLSAVTSCGCASIVSSKGSTVDLPLRLKPGEQVEVTVLVDTDGRTGEYTVEAGFRTDNARAPAVTATVRMNVLSGWRASGPHIVYNPEPGGSWEDEIYIGDSYDDPGIGVSEVFCTDSRFRVSYSPLPEDERPFESDVGWRARHRITVARVGGPDRAVHEPAVIVRGDDGERTIRIPIIDETAEDRALPPAVLALPQLASGQECTRLVRFPAPGDATGILLEPAVDMIKVEDVMSSSGDAVVRLRIRGPIDSSQLPESLVIRSGGPSRRLLRHVDLMLADD